MLLGLLLIFLLSPPFSQANPDGAGPQPSRCDRALIVKGLEKFKGTPAQDFFYTSRIELECALAAGTAADRTAALEGHGRGILFPAGGREQLYSAYISILVLRTLLNCTLPIEVVYNGPGEAPDSSLAPLFAELSGVRLIDGAAVPLPAHHSQAQADAKTHGWSFKVWALCYVTTFTEVVLMDSDNFALLDPASLFDTKEYQEHGNLFWPGWLRGGESFSSKPQPEIYRRLGLKVPWEGPGGDRHRTAESGQLLIHRARHADVLEYLWWLNSHHKHLYKYLHGDKDTFPLAFYLAGKGGTYQQVPYPARQALGYVRGDRNGMSFHHRGMVHHAPDGRLAFHHRTSGAKLEHCWRSQLDVERCRVVALSVGLAPYQALQCGQRAWTWRERDLLLDPHKNLQCAKTSTSLMSTILGGAGRRSAAEEGTQGATTTQQGGGQGSRPGAKGNDAATSGKGAASGVAPVKAIEGHWRPLHQGKQGLLQALGRSLHRGPDTQQDTALSMQRHSSQTRTLQEQQVPPALAVLDVAADVWRSYYSQLSHPYPSQPNRGGGADADAGGKKVPASHAVLAHSRTDSGEFSWPERHCSVQYKEGSMPLPVFPLAAYGPGGDVVEAIFNLFERNRGILLGSEPIPDGQ